jgi:hypothetical protein
VTDPVGTPNSFSDNIFTGGGSKDVNGITQWQWKLQMPQDKDDIENAFGASVTSTSTGHTLLFGGLDRYAANGNSTVGFWFLQNPVSANANGTFSGVHKDGDILLVLNFPTVGSNPVVNVFRWTGTDASGSLTAVTPPAGSTFSFVNGAPFSVPWSFIDKYGFTTPQAGEFLEVGLDLTAVFGPNVPHFASFLSETRSSNSTTATLSDFALGTVNTIGTMYKVKIGQYSNTVTATGVDQGTNKVVSATDTNYHFGVVTGPQLAAALPAGPQVGDSLLSPAQLTPIVTEALALWATVTNVPALTVKNIPVVIADLPDGGPGQLPVIGYTNGTVLIDVNAGGFGWFIDPTPADNTEFVGTSGSNYLTAPAGSPAAGRMDLLTVVMHELGHVFGLEDLSSTGDAHDLMATTLVPGERRLPGHVTLPLSPTGVSSAVTPVPMAEEQTKDLMATEVVSAFAGPRPATAGLSSLAVASGMVLNGQMVPTGAVPGFSPVDLALLALFPVQRPAVPPFDNPEGGARPDGTAELTSRQYLDAVFTALTPAQPPVPDHNAAGSAPLPNFDTLVTDLDEKMLADVARFMKNGLAARRLPG